MKNIYTLFIVLLFCSNAFAQKRKAVVLGSSTAAGVGATVADSSWAGRFNTYYKHQLGAIDTTYNLAIANTACYNGMPTTFISPVGRPAPDPSTNVTKAVDQLSDIAPVLAANGVIIVNFPSDGYATYSIAEIMQCLQTIYDSATAKGNRCFICTTQPRADGGFNTSSIKKKLADIKDSILNRFGTAHSINFWDGMFNPADSTIWPTYAAGDNANFNNAGHRVLFNRILQKNIFNLTYTAAAGDYRSNVNPTGLWSSAASWQSFNGTSWVAAASAPNSTSGVVTIVNGDSIRMNTAVTFDQVIIENGAVLNIFNTSTATTFTLNDGQGIDIENNGRLYIANNATVTGSGDIINTAAANITLRNGCIVQVNTGNDGAMMVSGNATIQNATCINKGIFTLLNNTLYINNAIIINNDSVSIASNADSWFAGTGSGYLVNNTNARMYKANAAGIAYVTAAVSFTNTGSLKGIGQYNIASTNGNTGIVTPGSTPAIITINPTVFTTKNPVLQINLRTTGAVAGINDDQLLLSSATNTDLAKTALVVTDYASDPVGTVYTIVIAPAGTVSGPFANVSLSATLGNLTYYSNYITVQKVAMIVLAVNFGNFTAIAKNGQAVLYWNTLQESNTAHFDVEHTTDGISFTKLGEVKAAGNSSVVTNYTFTHTTAAAGKVNYYRLKQVDADGKFIYSAIATVKFSQHDPVITINNPAQNQLKITSSTANLTVKVIDMNGSIVAIATLNAGINTISCNQWSTGIYQLSVFDKGRLVETLRFLKQ